MLLLVILCLLISCKSRSAAVSHLSVLVILPAKGVPAHPFSSSPYRPFSCRHCGHCCHAGTVDTAVIVGVVVAVVIVILILILGIFVIVLVYMKRRDTSESRGGRHLGAMGWEGVEYRMQ